ncbi:MAG: hypothetical protein DYH06_15655, partial [Acidobacteria bacterium ACB2]|nr:hypothetical protein [Acidobacteria bacterium ACB2]
MPTLWLVNFRPLPGIVVLRRAAGILAVLAATVLGSEPAAAYSVIHSHMAGPGFPSNAVVADTSGNLYGTTYGGGASNGGTVFTIRTDGTGFSVLHSFTGGAHDGWYPRDSLILDASGNLYGTTYSGGSSNLGTVFKIKTDGTDFSVLHSFAGGAGDGWNPEASLILDASGNLYGTTYFGGASNRGTVFTIKTDGSGFSVLHLFAGGAGDGSNPEASVILDASGTLYGTTRYGGVSDRGTVFTIKTDGSGFSVLHSFAGGPGDGQYPWASLILDASGNLYGTTYSGGASNTGTVFRIKTDGSGFSVLHSFSGGAADGQNPEASLVLDASGNLYGTTPFGGSSGSGTVFRTKTDGSGFSVLRSFAGGAADGRNPRASLILDASGNLYGTTAFGGSFDSGTVFTIKTDGAGSTLLHSFGGDAGDGSQPYASLILDASGNLFGTTAYGGAWDRGTVFTMKTDGTGLSVLHSFAGGAGDGQTPVASLILDASGNLYGTTHFGGASNDGTVFTIKTDGTGFAVLHLFAGGPGNGRHPASSLILDSSGNLYGTTFHGGASDAGAVFTMKTDGTGFSVLRSLPGGPAEGQYPEASLTLDSSGNLYGTTDHGGSSNLGTVFTMRTDGTGFRVLHSFVGGSGDGQACDSLILDDSGSLYGTTGGDGTSDLGTVFTIKTDGTGFSVLHSFAGGAGDGETPYASLILDASGNLYGTTYGGGASSRGTVFTIKTDGTGFSLLHSFAGGASDGRSPYAPLILDASGNLYGTTYGGGTADLGTEFTLPSLCAMGAPTGEPAARCGAGTLVLSASGAGAGQDYKWYDMPLGGTLLQTGGASFTTPPMSTTTTYHVSVYDTTTLCESGRMAVTATVNPIPAAPTAGSEPTVCQGESIHLTATDVPGATYSWTGPDGFVSALQNPVITNAQPAASGTYSVTVTADGCESAPGTTTTAVTADAQAPTVTAPTDVVVFQSLCCATFGGADPTTSPALAAFLSGATATDDCVAAATALAPQAGGFDVTGTTCFEVGTTTVTFRFSDAAGNVGTDTADVTVRMYGDLNIDATVDPADMVVLQSYFNSAATPEVPPFGAPEAMAD